MQKARPLILATAATALLWLGVGCAPIEEAATPPASSAPVVTETPAPDRAVSEDIAGLEAQYQARVGVSALDTASGDSVQYRADERFGFASTIKVFAAAAMLRQIPEDQRDARLTWTQEEMMAAGYSPVAEERLGTGMTIREAAEAAVRRSDNTAMNLVLGRIGGPAGLDAELVQLGDTTTEAIDSEPELNRVDPGSPANTTTPAAFTAALHEVMRSDYLSPTDRAVLIEWMSGNATGDALIRAGAPAGWEVADKSGGAGGIRNDIAIVTPPGRAPLILTVMTAKDDPAAAYEDELVAAVARTVLSAFE